MELSTNEIKALIEFLGFANNNGKTKAYEIEAKYLQRKLKEICHQKGVNP